jgi:hypothetical protein
MLDRCCGLVNVSSTPVDSSVRRSSNTARLRTCSANSAEVRRSRLREVPSAATSCGVADLLIVRISWVLVMVRLPGWRSR